MKSIRLIFGSALIAFIGVFVSRLLGYLYKVVVARYDPNLYGNYSLAMSIVGLIVPFAMMGLSAGLLQWVGKHPSSQKSDKYINTSLQAVFIVSVILAVTLYHLSSFIGSFFSGIEIETYLKLFSFTIPLSALFGLFGSILRAKHRVMEWVLIGSVVQGVLELGLVFVFLKPGFELGALFLSTFAPLLFVCAFFLFRTQYLTVFKSGKFNFSLILFSLPLIFGTPYVFTSMVDTLLIGHFSNSYDIALYNVALPTAQMILIFSTSLLTLFIPLIAKNVHNSKPFIDEYRFVVKWILLTTLPILCFVSVFHQTIMQVLFGKSFIDAGMTFFLLCAAYFVLGLSLPFNSLFQIFGKPKLNLLFAVLLISCSFVASFLIIPLAITQYSLGSIGAAISSLIVFTIISSASMYYSYLISKIHPFSYKNWMILASSLISILLIGIIYFFFHTGNRILTLFVFGSAFCLVYIGFLVLFKVFDKSDKMIFARIIERLTGFNLS